MIELTDANFDENLNLINIDHISLIIGTTNGCFRCKELLNNLDNLEINYGNINLNINEEIMKKIGIKLKINSINVPLIILFKDGKFIKKIPNKFTTTHILNEINNL